MASYDKEGMGLPAWRLGWGEQHPWVLNMAPGKVCLAAPHMGVGGRWVVLVVVTVGRHKGER